MRLAEATCSTSSMLVKTIVIKDINVPGSTSQEMTESKLLNLVNSRSVVCQPWTNHPTLAKKVVYYWKNGILKRVRTLFQLTENDQKILSRACSIYPPAMPPNSQDFRHNALT